MNLTSSMLLILAGAAATSVLTSSVKADSLPDLKAEKAPANAIWLEELDIKTMSQQFGNAQAGKSLKSKPIIIGGEVFPHGVGSHAYSEMTVDLKGQAVRFLAMVGVDDEVIERNIGSVTFEVWVDGKKKADSGLIKFGEKPRLLDVDLTGAKRLLLIITNGDGDNNADHADWGGALIIMKSEAAQKPEAIGLALEDPIPMVSGIKPEPSINGPKVVGTTPGRPFMFLVPATGEGPLVYSADDLPAGLSLNPKTGIITGSVEKAGEYDVMLLSKVKEVR